MTELDPLDLALLAAGWEYGRLQARESSFELSLTRAEVLVDVARMLSRLWAQMDDTEWDGVFAYDVAEPLGRRMGRHFAEHRTMPSLTEAESWARELIAEA